MTRLVLQHSLREPGHIVNIGSVAGRWAYPNGATYVTSKFAVRGFTRALREDLLGRDIRVTTVDAGLVETEFSIVRFRGDADKAKAVYEGTRPLSAEDVAGCILFALTRPEHVVVDELVLMSIDQSSGARVHRKT
jgi:NADP-dependent 3-hydroxy acid dehydrogenase YdfG